MELTIVITSPWKLSWSTTWNEDKKGNVRNCFLTAAIYDGIFIGKSHQNIKDAFNVQLLPHSYKRCQIFSSLVTSQAHPDLNIGEALCINIFFYSLNSRLCMEWFRFLAVWLWKLPKGVKELQNHGISHLTTLNKLSCTYPCSVKPQWKTSWRKHLKWYHDKLLKALLPWNRTFALICSWQVTSEY